MTMDQLALQAQTDKSSDGHGYAKIYESYLEPLRNDPVLLFELGIGGYQYPDRGGQSLKMWYNYFLNGKIVGVDYYKKDGLDNDRTTVVLGSQDDANLMAQLVAEHGAPDIIVDDASHDCPLTIKSFEILFPLLKPGGLYFCEDVHTSYWLDYHGHPDPSTPDTTMAFFQALTAQLSQDTLLPEYRNQFAGYLDFIHFYRNLVVIKKK